MKDEKKCVPELRFPEYDNYWEETKIDDVTIWCSGGTPSKKIAKFWDGKIPWISASTMHSDTVSFSRLNITPSAVAAGSRLSEVGDVLLLVRGSMLFKRIPVCTVENTVAFNQDVKSITALTPLSSQFLFYWLKAMEGVLLSMVTGTGIGLRQILENNILTIQVTLFTALRPRR